MIRVATSLALAACAVGGLALASPEFDFQGHRGFAGRFPENSMVAFREALALGVTTLELDLQITRNRVVIVHHDPRLNGSRCTMDGGGPVPGGPIAELEYEVVSAVDCRKRADDASEAVRIPRLSDVFELARDADYPVLFNIEIKLQGAKRLIPVDEFAQLTVNVVREAEMVSIGRTNCETG